MGRVSRVGCYCLETGASMAENWSLHGVIAVSLEWATEELWNLRNLVIPVGPLTLR